MLCGVTALLYQVMAPSRKIYAVKRIRLEGRDAETATGFIDEIRLLTRLRNQPNIIQLVDAEVRFAVQLTHQVKVHEVWSRASA